MNIPQRLTEIIELIQHNKCMACQYGSALVTLRNVRDQLARADQARPDSTRIKPHTAAKIRKPKKSRSLNENPSSDPVEKQEAATKSQRQAALQTNAVRSHKATEKLDAILNFVAANPACKSAEVAKGTGIPKDQVRTYLKDAKKQGRVLVTGATSSARWSLAKPAANIPAADDDFADIDAGLKPATPNPVRTRPEESRSVRSLRGHGITEFKFECNRCHSKFLTQQSRDGHNCIASQEGE